MTLTAQDYATAASNSMDRGRTHMQAGEYNAAAQSFEHADRMWAHSANLTGDNEARVRFCERRRDQAKEELVLTIRARDARA